MSGVEELRADLGRRLGGSIGGGGGGGGGVEEVGTARIVFAQDGSSFTGLLVTSETESFSLYARRGGAAAEAEMEAEMEAPCSSSSSASSAGLPTIGLEPPAASQPGYDVTLVEEGSGSTFALKGLRLCVGHSRPGFLSLESDQLHFETEEILVGDRADAEIRHYLSPELAGMGVPVHIGTMSLNCPSALTPPPTPSSVLDSDDHQAPEDMDQDFMR